MLTPISLTPISLTPISANTSLPRSLFQRIRSNGSLADFAILQLI